MENTIQLSNPATIKAYFEKVRQLAKQGERFPVNLDDVWPLVYAEKGKAVRVLKKEYFEDEDYLIFAQNGKNSGRGRSETVYKLSVSCMEHLVARKVRPVFEVYRQVFHSVADQLEQSPAPLAPAPYYLPQTKAEALRALADAEEEKEALALQLRAVQPKIEHHDRVMNAEGNYTMANVAQNIGTGQNRLFEFLRSKKILFYDRGHNRPYQQYIDDGCFIVRQKTFRRGDAEQAYPQLFVTPKGAAFIRKKWDGNDFDDLASSEVPNPSPVHPLMLFSADQMPNA